MDKDDLQFGKTFCPYPFLHFHIDTRKRKRLCCHSTHEIDRSTDYNTQKYKEIRQSMLDGLPVSGCQVCYDKEQRQEISERQKSIKDMMPFQSLVDSQVSDHVSGKDIMPYWYDLRLSNNCNLACQMCGPSNSSTIAKNMGLDQPFLTHEIDIDVNPDALRLYLSGGEPFMIKRFVDLLSKIENKDCEIIVNTNGTIVTEAMLGELSRFTDVCMNVSIDGHGSLNEKIRRGSKWDDVDKNVDLFLSKGWTIQVVTVLQNDNILHLMPLARYLEDKGIRRWHWLEVEGSDDIKWQSNMDLKTTDVEPLLDMGVTKKNILVMRLLRRVIAHAQDVNKTHG